MKSSGFKLALAFALLAFGCAERIDKSNTVNAILGDASYISAFGIAPAETTDETVRIKTHLKFVEMILRKKDVSHLSAALQEKRQQLLDLLRDYRAAGVFPKNYDHSNARVPCFIDIKGNICAVGYLIEKTAGRALAEAINEKFKYSEILSMRDEAIENWISGSGLTRYECAMIQPAYQWPGPVVNENENDNYITPGYAIGSALVAGLNVSLSTVNAVQLGKGAKSPAAGVFGLWTGAGSIVFGAIAMPAADTSRDNQKTQTLSIINIGLGATTLVLSICNLTTNKPKKKDRSVSWNLYSYPEPENGSGVAISVTKRL